MLQGTGRDSLARAKVSAKVCTQLCFVHEQSPLPKRNAYKNNVQIGLGKGGKAASPMRILCPIPGSTYFFYTYFFADEWILPVPCKRCGERYVRAIQYNLGKKNGRHFAFHFFYPPHLFSSREYQHIYHQNSDAILFSAFLY